MSSSTNPVPSRNALRALRNLAFAHPAAFAGAVGSACCTAAVSCEIQRRVRLAEKLVASKRTLRSISDGKGNARVARMCEAAEKGENFLLDQSPAQQRRRRRVRNHSTVAVQRHDEEDQDHPLVQPQWKEPDAGSPSRRSDGSNAIQNSDATERARRSEKRGRLPAWTAGAAQTFPHKHDRGPYIPPRGTMPEVPAAKDPESHLGGTAKHAWIMDSQRQQNTASAEKVRAASMKVLKPRDYHIYGQKGNTSGSDAAPAADFVLLDNDNANDGIAEAKALRELGETGTTGFESFGTTLPEASSSASTSAPEVDGVVSSQDDIAPAPEASGDDAEHASSGLRPPSMSLTNSTAVESTMSDTGTDRAHLSDTTMPTPFEWQSPLSDFLSFDGGAEYSSGTDPANLYSRISENIDRLPLLDSDNDRSGYFRHVYGTEAQSDIDTQPTRSQPPRQRPQTHALNFDLPPRVFQRNFSLLCESGHFEEAERVYSKNYDPRRHGFFPHGTRLLVQHLLSDASTHRQAVRVLFPRPDLPTGARGSREQRLWLRAHYYMQEICALIPDPKMWETQATAILNAARAEGIAGHASVLESVTRSLCAQGLPKQAEELIRSVTKSYDLDRHIRLDQLLALGYARNHDWTAVNRIMQSLQDLGVPRERPKWYSILFRDIFTLHLQDHSLELTYDYLVNAMGYWKLTPTRPISCALITACIKTGDYVHLQQWLEAIRSMWPRIDIGTSSRKLAMEIGMAWIEKQATCEQIERACCALASGAIDDPFSPYFRAVTQQVATADLRRRVEVCAEHAGYGLPLEEGRVETLPQLIAFAERYLMQDLADDKCGADKKLALESLSHQLRALERLDQVMAGGLPEYMADSQTSASEHDTGLIFPIVPEKSLQPMPRPVPAALQSSALPHMRILWPVIAEDYACQHRQGRSFDHGLLEHVVIKLQSQGRDVEAAHMLESVAESPFVTGRNGKRFSARLFGEWLGIASRLASVKQGHKAMWAMLDAARDLELTAILLLRVAHVSQCIHTVRWGRETDPGAPDKELHYLETRLRKLKWVQTGMKPAPKLPEWTRWEVGGALRSAA